MATEKDKPLLDFSNGPALVGSVKDSIVRGATALKDGASSVYDSVSNTTKDAIDTTKATISGDIELPEGSQIEKDFFNEFSKFLSKDEIAKIKAEGVVSAEMIRAKLIPKLMTIDSQAKLQKLRTTFQTHSRLAGLIEVYGFAPIKKGEAIPRSQANNSQFVREAKLTGKQAWSDLVQGARGYWNINSEMDDIAVGRHLVAMRGKALISAISSIYGNEKKADNPERLNTTWAFTEWKKGDDLAEAVASKNNDKFKKITTLTPDYTRSTLHNDYIMALVQASANPEINKIEIAGIKIEFPDSETEKLEEIANELDAMREGVEKADPGKFRKFMGGVYQLGEAGEAIIDLGIGVVGGPVWAINTFGPLTVWILASTATVGLRRGDPKYSERGIAGKIWGGPGKLLIEGGKMMAGKKGAPKDDAEKTRRQSSAMNPEGDFGKIVKGYLNGLEAAYKRARDAGDVKGARDLEKRRKELNDWVREYKDRYTSGNLLETDVPDKIKVTLLDIHEGRGPSKKRAIYEAGRGNILNAVERVKQSSKNRFGTADGYMDAEFAAEKALKGVKNDPIPLDPTDPESPKFETHKPEHRTNVEITFNKFKEFYKYRAWNNLYTVYKKQLELTEKARYEVTSLKASATSTLATPSTGAAIITNSQEGLRQAQANLSTHEARLTEQLQQLMDKGVNIDLTKITTATDATTGKVTINDRGIVSQINAKMDKTRKVLTQQFSILGLRANEVPYETLTELEVRNAVLQRTAKPKIK